MVDPPLSPRTARAPMSPSQQDPFLGAHLVPSVIHGIQGTGVIANAKHFVQNNQEDNRGSYVAQVDERTQYELYYPPFEAAIGAGVGSVMCSYNNVSTAGQLVRGESFWACENPDTLTTDLKGRLGFQGWVMSVRWGSTIPLLPPPPRVLGSPLNGAWLPSVYAPFKKSTPSTPPSPAYLFTCFFKTIFSLLAACQDWGATHSTHQAAIAGLDQEMPSGDFFGDDLQAAVEAGHVDEAVVDDKVVTW